MPAPNDASGLICERILLPEGWATDRILRFSQDGLIAEVAPAGERDRGLPRARGIVIPGMPNAHSHAFQYAMAGMTERGGERENFWSWRDTMYKLAARIDPETLEAVAAQLYADMLCRGYTAVGEFHYLHHDPSGAPYADPCELSERIVAAARRTGIALTHLPVLYAYGGFGEAPVTEPQRRFATTLDAYIDLLETLSGRHVKDAGIRLGMAAHSLRAVSPPLLSDAVSAMDRMAPDAPIHIHVAEQEREVEEAESALGARPVDWLLDNHDLSARWCLIHATHMTAAETLRLAQSGAVAGLCPTTEANLGDGLFDAPTYLAAAGRFAIGSDSHVTVDPAEELRWLEYGQRLTQRRRGVLAASTPHIGAGLYRAAVNGGMRALGWPTGGLRPGCRADFLVLDTGHPALLHRTDDTVLDAYIFAATVGAVRDVYVAGARVVEDGRHRHADDLLCNYEKALRKLLD
ncbi:MAG: formimidoylglutamate deiminase [Alphaproteobacteria bacterium]|nr:formimidoylglutamate deiminase [Alphaproteobacteria bacterium]